MTARFPPITYVAISSVIIFSYLVGRYLTYINFPATDFSTWVVQDAMMNIPRGLGAAVCLLLGLAWYGRDKMGLHWRGWKLPAAMGLCFCLASFVFGLTREPFVYSSKEFVLLSMSSFFVAVFEELMFRGILFQSVRHWLGDHFAIWGTTLVFVIYHYGAQPLWGYPQIFLIGGAFAIARSRGCSLYALILAHGIFDTNVFLVQGQGGPGLGWNFWGWLTLLSLPMGVMVLGIWPRKKGLENP